MSVQALARRYGLSCGVYRLQATTGSKKQYTRIATEQVMLSPMSAIAAQTSQLTFGRAFNGYVRTNANIQIGDYIQDPSGNKYDMQGSQNYTMGTQPLIALTLQRQATQGQI